MRGLESDTIGGFNAMNDKQYYVRGCIALLDAVGGAVHHMGNVHKYSREEDRPEKAQNLITRY